jgi:hypothetical protein
MTELETIAHAKSYLEKMANGINPLTGEAVPETDLINQVRISRCLFFVSDICNNIQGQPFIKTGFFICYVILFLYFCMRC